MQGWIRAQGSSVFVRRYKRLECGVCCGESLLQDINWMYRAECYTECDIIGVQL